MLVKTDSGPGHQAKCAKHLQFRREMHLLGLHQVAGLPNTTQATQEQDDWYQIFKAKTYRRVEEIFSKRTLEMAESLQPDNNGKRQKIKTAKLTNNDIQTIVNGMKGDPIEKRPFNSCATKANIFKSWMNVGFVPFTRNALKHEKVRHELGDGGASEDMTQKLQDMTTEYESLKSKVSDAGLNESVFNVKLPVHKKKASLQKSEEEQVAELVKKKGAFKAGAQWCTLGFTLMGSRAIIKAQAVQLQEESANKKKKQGEKDDKVYKRVDDALNAYKIYKTCDNEDYSKMSIDDWKSIIMFLLPVYDASVAPSKFTSKKKMIDRLFQFEEQYGMKWDQCLSIELEKATAKRSAQEVATGTEEGDYFSSLKLDIDSDLEVESEEEEAEL